MDRRRPAAGEADAIARQNAAGPDLAASVDRSDDQSADAPASARAEHGVPGQHLAAGGAQGGGLHRAIVVRTHVDDRDLDPRRLEIRRRRVGGRARGDDHRALSRHDAIAVDEHAQALGQHDARPIVAGEHQRALVRAGRQHDLARAHLPQALARQVRVRVGQVVGDPLHQAHVVVVVIAEGGGARQQRDVAARREPGQRILEPGPCRLAVDGGGQLVQQRAAHLGLLVGKHDALAALRRRQRGRQARRTGADDEHVAVRVGVLIAVGVRRRRCAAETCCGANGRLVDPVPEGARPHERLVVEAGDEDRRQRIVDGADVEVERRPSGSASAATGRATASMADARLFGSIAAASAIDRQQRVRLLGSVAEDAARAVKLERPADEVDAVGEQRRGDRVAGERLQLHAVEPHRDRFRAVDAAAPGETVGLHHRLPRYAFGPIGPALAHGIGADDPVARRIAQRVEPALAAVRVQPALGMHALRVGAIEEIIRPGCIIDLARAGAGGRCALRRRTGTRSPGAHRSRGR